MANKDSISVYSPLSAPLPGPAQPVYFSAWELCCLLWAELRLARHPSDRFIPVTSWSVNLVVGGDWKQSNSCMDCRAECIFSFCAARINVAKSAKSNIGKDVFLKLVGFKAFQAQSLFSLASLAECRGRVWWGRGRGGCKNVWVTQKKRDDMWAFDRGGWDEGGTTVGGALRNAWKVSAETWRLLTDNPPYLITIPLPTTLILALLSFCLQTLKPVRKTHCLLTFTLS